MRRSSTALSLALPVTCGTPQRAASTRACACAEWPRSRPDGTDQSRRYAPSGRRASDKNVARGGGMPGQLRGVLRARVDDIFSGLLNERRGSGRALPREDHAEPRGAAAVRQGAQSSSEEYEVIVARIDLSLSENVRQHDFNFAKHRRPEHYRLIVERAGASHPLSRARTNTIVH
jgi:hypothetical protein